MRPLDFAVLRKHIKACDAWYLRIKDFEAYHLEPARVDCRFGMQHAVGPRFLLYALDAAEKG